MASHRRGPWSQVEDAYLCQLVQTQGALNWVRIAQLIGSRSPKQCRERYHQNLKPTLNHEPISPEEGVQIERMVAEMGKRWAEIARRLHGRSDNAVKNWWNGSMNRRRRSVLRGKSSNSQSQMSSQPHHHHHHHHHHFDAEGDHHLRPYSQPPTSHSIYPGPYQPPQPIDVVMSSPTVSEASRAESVDGTPSLVSDAGSVLSFSPPAGSSPGLELPPLNYHSQDLQRPSLPGLPLRMNQYSPGSESHSFLLSPLHNANNVNIHSGTSSPGYPRLDQHRYTSNKTSLLLSPQVSKDAQFQAYMDPSVRLPPLRPNNQYTPPTPPSQTMERDSRMHLSTLLG